jgi:hypothetical protein
MSPAETELVRRELAAASARAEIAERRAVRAEQRCNLLQSLLARSRTTLAESNACDVIEQRAA